MRLPSTAVRNCCTACRCTFQAPAATNGEVYCKVSGVDNNGIYNCQSGITDTSDLSQ
jgi:hypothetical protein